MNQKYSNHYFVGELVKFHLVSNNICYGPPLEAHEEVEQHLTITADGKVQFTAYCYGENGEYEECRRKEFSLLHNQAYRIFYELEDYFYEGYEDTYIGGDIGNWTLTLENTGDDLYLYHGPLSINSPTEDWALSNLIRRLLDMPDLFVFDGNPPHDHYERITVDYRSVTDHEHSEQIIIDRVTESIKHTLIDSNQKITHLYEFEGTVPKLLDDFSYGLFPRVIGNPEDAIVDTAELREYQITLDTTDKQQRIIKGSYDRLSLPVDYARFNGRIHHLLHSHIYSELFDPALYSRRLPRKSDYIYCSVKFENSYRKYHYISDDSNINIDDMVIVPVGEENRHTIAQVVDIDYCNANDVPYPLEKTKHIIRKCTEHDLEEDFYD